MVSVKTKHIHSSILDTCNACLHKLEQTKSLNAFITILKNDIPILASESHERMTRGIPKSKLDGITIAVKDNFCMKNVRTTCASKMLENFFPSYDATVVKKLKNAGAIIVGKTNLDEFAMGSGTVNSIFGPTLNIWSSPLEQMLKNIDTCNNSTKTCDNYRIAGGSSGGGAVAVATNTVFGAIGSDTGGSTRNPASYCGVVGFKPSYGTVSRYGLIPLVNSMDVPGILAQKVEHVATIFNVISGPDEHDSTMIDYSLQPINLENEIDISTITIGIPTEYRNEMISDEIYETWQYVTNIFKNAGVHVKEISLPHTSHSIVTYSILNACEVASNMSRYSGILFGHRCKTNISTEQLIAESRCQGFSPVVRSRILSGNYFLLKRNYDKYFNKAMKVRRLIANDFNNAWSSGVNVLLTPTTLSTAPLLSDFTRLDNRTQCATQDYCTQPANMAGCPAISVPICLSKDGLPISLQLISKNYTDALLLQVAKWLQSAVSFPHLVS